jgi:hypothetical protein
MYKKIEIRYNNCKYDITRANANNVIELKNKNLIQSNVRGVVSTFGIFDDLLNCFLVDRN